MFKVEHLEVNTNEPEKLADELEKLCQKYAIKDEYYFKWEED